MEDKRKALYNALSGEYDLGTYEDFTAKINDESKRRALYDAAGQDYNLGTYEEYSEKLGFGASGNAVPMFEDAPQTTPVEDKIAENSQKLRGFWANFKEGLKGLGAGVEALAGEGLNIFTGSSREEKAVLNDMERLEEEGTDMVQYLANKDDDAFRQYYGMSKDEFMSLDKKERRQLVRKAASKVSSEDFVLPDELKERQRQEARTEMLREVFDKALTEAGGDLTKAKQILSEKAENPSLGDDWIGHAAETKAGLRESEGFWGWVGQLVPQMIPTATSIALNVMTKGKASGLSRLIGYGGIAGLTASSAGDSMIDAREAGATNLEVWTTGLANASIEVLTEKIPFDRITKRVFSSAKANVAERMADAVLTPKGRKELERLLSEANEKLGGKLFSKTNLAEWLTDAAYEASGEFAAGALQTMTAKIYENPEDYPTLSEALLAGWEGAKAGLFMGAVTGGASVAASHAMNKDRRQTQGYVDVAQIENEDGDVEVVEVVGENPEDGTVRILRGDTVEDVSSDKIGDRFRFSYEEFENGRLRSREDDAIDNGVVNDGQIRGMEETIQRDLNELQNFFTAEEIDQIASGTIPANASTEGVAAARRYMEDVQRIDDLQKAKAEQDQKRKDAVRDRIESEVGQRFWMQEEGEDDGSGIIPVAETVEEVVYSDGRVGYVVGADADGNLTMVFNDGTRGFSSRAEIADKENSGEILSNTVMGLDDYLAIKVDIDDVTAETTRMEQEQAANVQSVQEAHPIGSTINVGTAEAKVDVPIIAVNADGVIVQMPDGTTPQLTWSDVAHADGQEVRPKTNAELDQEIVDEYKVAYQPAVKTSQEPSITEREVEVEQTTPANPLPLKGDGSVDQTALWNKDPERWAQWNDEQRQDGGANSLAYVSGAIAKEQAKIAELQAAYAAESDFDARSAMESEIAVAQDRLNRLTVLQQNYAPPVAQQDQPVQTESSVEGKSDETHETNVRQTVIDLYNDAELSEEEIEEYIKANIRKSQSELDKHLSKAPKMGTDISQYKEKRAKHAEKTAELEKQLRFWKDVHSYVEVPTTQFDMEPQNALEFAARELSIKDGIKLQPDSFKRHTGYGAEIGNFLSILRTKEKGGLTLEAAGERLMELDRENSTGFFDQGDPNAGLNAILDVLGGTRTSGDISGYIKANREQTAKEEVAAARNAMMEEIGTEVQNIEVSSAYQLSDEVDENGRQFVLTSDGSLSFGEITAETGLTPAPILLSEGLITNPATNDGYGLVHIEARHGDQIRNAGYSSVVEFIEEVANNYEVIREGKNRDGHQTYMLQLTDKHNNTLMVELSGDGTYWNINTAGIFKTSYGANRKEVYNRHTTDKQSVETVEASQVAEQSDTQPTSSMNASTTSSEDKDSNIVESAIESEEKVEEIGDIPDDIWESSLDEDMPDFTNSASAYFPSEEMKQKFSAMRARINEWAQKLGVQVRIMETLDDVVNQSARQQVLAGRKVYGYFDPATGEVAFYLPDFLSLDGHELTEKEFLSEIDKTYIHEVVAHRGLRGLLGEEKYGELCDMVWDAMTEQQKANFLNYPGVNGNSRIAADEFIAHFAENVDYNDNRTLWDKIVDFIKDFFNSVELPAGISNESLAELLRHSYRNLAKNGAKTDSNSNQQADGNVRFRTQDILGFAQKHHVSEKFVSDFADAMARNSSSAAAYALKEIKRELRINNTNLTFAEFAHVYAPIKQELFEQFGDYDALHEAEMQRTIEARNLMEAAEQKAREEAEKEMQRLKEFEDMDDIALDEAYFAAMEAGDVSRMRDIVNDAARRNGYEDTDFRMAHKAPSYDEQGYDGSMVDVANNLNGFRDSIEEQFRMNRDSARQESVDAIRKAFSAIEKGEAPSVKVYRAVPRGLQEGSLRNGDWVTLSRAYAVAHGENALEGNYDIKESSVPASDLYWDGNDINEWGYDDKSDYKYKNTANNRKLNILVTRNNNGNVIPPSQRFNEKVNDVRFKSVMHGTGANFDRFDHQHMGEGEGAQAYGWGTYLTEVEGIARTYAVKGMKISDAHRENRTINSLARDLLLHNSKQDALDYLQRLLGESWSDKKRVRKQIKIIESGKFLPEGKYYAYVYTVEIPDDALYIVYEEAIAKQQGVYDAIVVALESEGWKKIEGVHTTFVNGDQRIIVNTKARGADLYAELSVAMGSDKAASEFLSRNGVVGISYPAQYRSGMRADGARNYVIFNEENAQIQSSVRFRAVTPEMDAEYMKAVKSGDLDTAQRMVDETADRVMKNSKVRDSQGKLIRVTHYSPNEFTSFDPQKIGSSTDWGVFGRGFYFSNKDHRLYGKNRYEGYLNLENPFIINGAEEAYVYKEAIADFAGVQYYEVGKKETDDYTDYLISQGYDGVIYNDTFSGFNEYVAFYPYQFKLADVVEVETKDDNGNVIPLSERFNPESSDIRFRTSNNNQAIFVSNAARAVEGIKQEKATPEQWLKMIEKNGGLKAGEDKWMGLSDWLKASDKKTFTKQEVLDFINEHMIVIEETHYAAGAEDDAENTYAMIERILQEKFGKYIAEYYEQNNGEDDNLYGGDSYEYAMDKLREEMNDEFPYTIERSNSVVYLTFPYEETDDLQEWADKLGIKFTPQNPINSTRLDYTTDGLENKHEIALTVPNIESWNEDDIHFGDAGDGRAVAWIRFGETWEQRPSPQISRKVLVIDEIQSKRHQEGRERGYISKEKERELREKFEKAKERFFALDESLREKYGRDFANAESNDEYMEILSPEDYREYMNAQMDFSDARLEMNNPRYDAVPDAPFDKNWHELAMKRMLRYAAENGYDVVAWTKGEQQAERYNIGDVVANVDYRLNDDGSYHVDTMSKLGYQIESIPTTFNSEQELADVFGKEIAKKIVGNLEENKKTIAEAIQEKKDIRDWRRSQGIDQDSPEYEDVLKKYAAADEKLSRARKGYTLSESDFRIGGEGMKGFYDKMLPAFMNKYGKKWGVKVEDISLPNLENGLTMHSVPVTEEMKESVMEGQVMFRSIPITQEVQDEMDAISATAIVRGNYLKAPNGADTNLTPEQWALVRTKAFKAWFGDWELPHKMIDVVRGSMAHSFANFDDARQWAKDNIVRVYSNEETNGKGEIEISNNAVKKYLSGSAVKKSDSKDLHLAVLKILPSVIRNGVIAETHADYMKDENGERTAESRINPDITIHRVYGAVRIGDNIYRVKVTLKEHRDENRPNSPHSYEATKIELLAGTLVGDNGSNPNTNNSISTANLLKGVEKSYESGKYLLDDYSKVVDKNGEPMVVYHGTLAKNLTRFDKDFIGSRYSYDEKGFFFISRESIANDYATPDFGTGRGAIIPAFINLKNPLFVDQKWAATNGLGNRVFKDNDVIEFWDNYQTLMIEESQNNDGVIISDGTDLMVVAFEPSQIKSATDNTGEFSADNNDIRFRTRYDVNTNPTEAQKKAGNYKMGHIRLDGYNITIENPKGSVRRGTDSKGNAWENTLNNDYGYIRGTEGVDGDHIDVYLSDNPTEGNVFVIDQVNPETREFDEHKVMYGFNSAEEAREAYLANFSEGWNGLGTITEVSKDEFKKWIESSHRKTKPFSEYKSVKTIGGQSEGEDMEDNLLPSTGTPTDEVVTNGLQLTPAQTAEVAANIFAALPEESRKKLTDGLNGNILGLKDAILQIPTSLASKENWNEEDKQMADVVAEEMTKMAGEMTRPFSASEGLWLLYNNLNKGTDLISQASRALVQRNLGFDAETLAKQEQAKEDVRFRTVGDATSNAQASLYNRGAVNVWTRLKESYVDMMASVEELVKAIEKRSGKVAQGFEDILLALNQQSSKGLAAMESYTQRFLKPMFDEIRRIMNETKMKYEDVVRYVILKHGLERNKKLAQRDARAHYQEIYDDIMAKINGMTAAQKRTYLTNAQLKEGDAKAELATLQAVDISAMTDEEKREHKKKLAKSRKAVEEAKEHLKRAQKIASMTEQEAQDELDKIFEKIENGTDSVYNEMRENDYSGISSMFYDQLGVDRKNFSTEEQYQAALMDAKKDKYSSLADVEAAAEAEVASFEGKTDTKELWKRINAATKETLRQQYEANMISKDQYDSLRNMFEYYVPLRGFKDNTAEDMYTYYRKPNSTGYTKPILGAEGRKTEAESPFGWIAAMAGSAIASNVKNEAKLALYYFVSNRPENGIATISKTWFVDSGEVDERGKKIFKPAYPPFSEDLSSDAAKDAYEAWQENMRELQKKGQAYEAGQRLNLGNAVVNISDANKPEHIVNVKVGGKDYTIVINGNPRAAQAINGDLNIEGTSQDYSALFGPVLRWMSSVNTSYNPEFWITNMMRDMAFTMMAVNIKEDPAYRRKFKKNYLKAFKVVSLVAKNENGTIGDSYLEQQYKDFVKYGGVTGYTQIKDSETWEQEIENYLSSNDPESIKNGKVMRGMKSAFHAAHRFGESLEQVSRFAAFLTARETGKSINEAINDAKEITVNFNRKGSGKMITLEEAKYLTGKNGQPLTKFQQWMAVGASSIAPLGRRFIMFFNAAIQGLNATYKLMKKNPKRFTGWALGYAAVGMMNAVLHAMLDDDDDYLDIPQYERRNSLMIGGNGAYFKWALPQEARVFYALGDLAVETIMGRNPHQNFLGEVLKIGTEILPVNPSEGWKAFMPSVAIPFIELALNEDYKGAPIYNDQKWLSEEEKERTAKWSSAYQGTGWTYVKIAQGLNFITGGDKHDAGWINLQPEKLEHLVQSAFGGTIRTADKFINTISAAIDPEEPMTVRQTPFLNRFLTINDERFKNVHVNDVFDYYKADAEHAMTLQKQYIKDRDMDSLTKLRSSDEYQWAKIYSKYKKPLKAIQEKIKVAEGTAERKELMKQQDELKKRMIKEISEL